MRCPECDYELRPGQEDCPRCSFRHAVRTTSPVNQPLPSPTALALAPPISAPTVAPRETAPVELTLPVSARRRDAGARAALTTVAAAALLLALFLLHRQAMRLTARQAQIQAIFAASDAPCRRNDRAACLPSVGRLRALGDFPDGSLLLGDCNIARYLRTLPGGDRLGARWRGDTFTAAELLTLGNAAYAQNLPVCRSFWMYAQVKRDHIDVPEYVTEDPHP